MGGADVVPGVSGGTVALILGIYDRLVRAVSRFDLQLLGLLRKREWTAAAEHVDLRFLATLGIGIASGIIGLASTMHFLLEDQEHISIHSLQPNSGTVRLNVGATHGGLAVGTRCSVLRRDPKTAQYVTVAELTIESYEEAQGSGVSNVRLAVAKPVDGATIAKIETDDVVTHESTRRPLTMAAFFGMILASGILVAWMVDEWTIHRGVAAVIGAVASFLLVGPLAVPSGEGNIYLFFCGMLAICAMILPGISGAYILLILGVYSEVTGLLRSVVHRQANPEILFSIAIFIAGCAIGLVSFSKLLNRFLRRHRQTTIAVLCGVMLGSLRKIWPFKNDLTPDASRFRDKILENVWPESFNGQTVIAFGVMVAAAGAVFLLDRLTAGHEHHPSESQSE